MPRIRSIKPDFFRDEKLQDLEVAHPQLKPMLVFEGLWTQSDKAGNFPWNPRVLHLDILPFIQLDLGASLVLLSEAGLLSLYIGSDGKRYGHVNNFAKHQRISGKEAQEPAKFPEKQLGSTVEATETAGREGERVIGKGEPELLPPAQHPLNCARRLIELVGLSEKIIRSVEAGIVAEMNFASATAEEAAQRIADYAMSQRAKGIEINKFWFDDTKWRNGNGKQPAARASAVEYRTSGNRQVLADLARTITAERTGPDGDELENGTRAADRGGIRKSAG